MMKLLTSLLLLIIGASTAFSQNDKPVKWDVKIQQLEGNLYQIDVKATIKDGFHIWGLDAGGDGSLINTQIDIQNEALDYQDKAWFPSVLPQKEASPFVDGTVYFYEKEITFSRKFSGSGATHIKGTITYQTCNESVCFPPEEVPFDVSAE